jgi:polar amino acid transport system substrate-binding protein
MLEAGQYVAKSLKGKSPMLGSRRVFAVGASAVAAMVVLAGCTAIPVPPSADERLALAPTGRLRVGIHPGSPTRGVIADFGRALAERLGVPFELVELKTQTELLAAVAEGRVDLSGTNASPARVAVMDFTAPMLDFELGYLVLPGSPVSTIADVNRPGVRIGVTQGSTSQTTLPAMLKNATVLPVPNLKAAGEMLSRRDIDAYATNKPILLGLSDGLPGSRILDGRWGVEHWAICVPKGRKAGLGYLRGFAEDARTSGMWRTAVEKAGLRGAVIP